MRSIPLRYTNYSIELAFDAARSYGIDRAYIMDFNYTTGDVDYFELPAWGEYDDAASTMNSIDSGRALNSIEITGSLCTEYCRAILSEQFGAIRSNLLRARATSPQVLPHLLVVRRVHR